MQAIKLLITKTVTKPNPKLPPPLTINTWQGAMQPPERWRTSLTSPHHSTATDTADEWLLFFPSSSAQGICSQLCSHLSTRAKLPKFGLKSPSSETRALFTGFSIDLPFQPQISRSEKSWSYQSCILNCGHLYIVHAQEYSVWG